MVGRNAFRNRLQALAGAPTLQGTRGRVVFQHHDHRHLYPWRCLTNPAPQLPQNVADMAFSGRRSAFRRHFQ